jgi:hypothetical protein
MAASEQVKRTFAAFPLDRSEHGISYCGIFSE